MIKTTKALAVILVSLLQACNNGDDNAASSNEIANKEASTVNAAAVTAKSTSKQAQMLTITGTVKLSDEVNVEDIKLITVKLIDHSLADAPFVLINEVELTNINTSPLTFTISYDNNMIEEYRSYSVSAKAYKMNEKNELESVLYTTQTYPVLTNGAGDSVEIYLSQH